MHRSVLTGFVILTNIGLGIFWVQGARSDDRGIATADRERAKAAAKPVTPRLLPGVQATGAIQLPNQWSLRPAGKQVTLGDFPVNIAVHPTGRWLAILHAGYGTHEVTIFDTDKLRQKIVCRAILDQALCGFALSPDGKMMCGC